MRFAERTLLGEGFAGSGPSAAHVNTVLGRKGGPVETAWATALATPRQGHIPFVAVLRPNMPVKPATLFINKADIRGDRHAELTWGAAQAGVAQGVLEAVADGTIPAGEVDDLILIAAVWVDWAADDEEAIYSGNVEATRSALAAGAEGRPAIEELLALRNEPANPFFRRS
ncbi:MAG: formaldehyde-activating enzyme [Gaiellaceae bacterium]